MLKSSRNVCTTAAMSHSQQLPGRALTKKSATSPVKKAIEDDEGYGTSPTTSSPCLDGNVFTFAQLPTAVSIKNVVMEDEWSSLEKDLNRVLNIQPLTETTVKKIDPLSSSSVRKPSRYTVPKIQRNREKNRVAPSAGKSQSVISCQFCANNGEVRSMVESHALRHPITRSIICPVLRKYVCELCGATGDNAHTKFYCPQNRFRNTDAPMAILLKKTRNNATGRRL